MAEEIYRLHHEWWQSRPLYPEDENEEDEEVAELVEAQVFPSQNSRKRLFSAAGPRESMSASRCPRASPPGKRYRPDSKDCEHHGATQQKLAIYAGKQLDKKVVLPAWVRQTKLSAGENDNKLVTAALVANQLLQQSIALMIADIESRMQGTNEYPGRCGSFTYESSHDMLWTPAVDFCDDDDPSDAQTDLCETLNLQRAFDFRLQSFLHTKYFKETLHTVSPSEIASRQLWSDSHHPNGVTGSPWARLRTHAPLNFRKIRPWTANDDKQLKQGVHCYYHSARLLHHEHVTLAEVAGVGLARLEDLLKPSKFLMSAMNDTGNILWEELVGAVSFCVLLAFRFLSTNENEKKSRLVN